MEHSWTPARLLRNVMEHSWTPVRWWDHTAKEFPKTAKDRNFKIVMWACKRCGATVYAIWEPTPLILRLRYDDWDVDPNCDVQLVRNVQND